MNKKHFLSLLSLLLAVLFILPACAKVKNTTDDASSSLESLFSDIVSELSQALTPSKQSNEPSKDQSPSADSSSKNDKSDPPKPEDLAIFFDKESISLKKGSSYTVSASLVPAGATLSDFSWYTSDESIATVENGAVKTLKTGVVLIGAVSADGESSDYLYINVVNAETEVSALSFSTEQFSIAVGVAKPLPLVVEPDTVPLNNLTFSVTDPSILEVDEQGQATAKKLGQTSVTVTSIDGKSATLQVTVTEVVNKVTQIVLDKNTLTLEVSQNEKLNATVLPEDADNKNIIFKAADSNVISVLADGTINALRTGTTTVTVLSHDGKVSATCTVTVTAGNDPFNAIDLSSSVLDPDQSGYQSGIRKKSSDEIMFSPTLGDFRSYLSRTGKDYDQFLGYIRFTALPVGDQQSIAFQSVTAEPKKAKGDWVDFFLVGDGIDCGFCPTAGAYYKIELIIVEKSTGKAVMHANFDQMQASDELKQSRYYKPTVQGGQVVVGPSIPTYTVTYKAVGGGIVLGLTEQTAKQGEALLPVLAVGKGEYSCTGWSDGKTNAARYDYAYANETLSAYFSSTNSESNIPVINLVTDSGKPITSKEYEGATLSITGADDPRFNITASLQIRGRGNSSWNGSASQYSYDSKNSYRIKLDEKEQLLGIGDSKNKDWVLNANKFDLSGLRNALVWQLAEKMGTMTYVPEYRWVQLYVNGQYRGMYLLTELIEDANDRVELDKTVTKSEDKGYLIEIDFRGNYEDSPYFYIDGYGPDPAHKLHDAREFVVKNDCTDEDLEYIQGYIEQCHEAFLSGDRARIEQLVDMASLIDMYILEELSKDVDVGATSFFLHKKEGGKLYFTAPWDFDFGFGTYGPAVSTYGLVSEGSDGAPWFAALVEQEWFRKEVYDRLIQLQPAFDELIVWLNDTGSALQGAADMNANHWEMYGNNYHQYVSSQVSGYLYSYPEHIEYLTEWTTYRWEELLYLLCDDNF